jgi:pimeloyl-ACP methyl ester carboxylesterase
VGSGVGRAIGSPRWFDADRAARRAVEGFERADDRGGAVRQLAAITTAADRTAALGHVRAPTLVVHGGADPVFDVSGGRATAAAVPGARLLEIDHMGHDLAPPLWPEVVAAIVENAHAA